MRKLLKRCLQKDTNRRFRSAQDVRIEIEEVINEPQTAGVSIHATERSRSGWIAIVLIALGFVAVTGLYLSRRSDAAPEMRLDIITPATASPLEFALSPNGQSIVFVASADGAARLWQRSLDQTDAQPIEGTENADFPFWSPDGRSIGYFANGKLYRVAASGGPPQALATVFSGRGGTWNVDGVILVASNSGGLMKVSASGGTPELVARPNTPRENSYRFPHFLPDNRHFLYYVVGLPEAEGVYLGSLDGTPPKRLALADSFAAYVSNALIFVRQGSLIAQKIDTRRWELMGDPWTIAQSIGYSGPSFAGFSVSADGRIAYRRGSSVLRQLKWVDRSGGLLSTVNEPDASNPVYPELSPDGKRVGIQRSSQGVAGDVWILDLTRAAKTRFTFDPGAHMNPIWSPDGTQLAFASTRNGPSDLYIGSVNQPGNAKLLLESPNTKGVTDWSKDGKFVVYFERDPNTGMHLWALPLTSTNAKPFVVAAGSFDEANGQFSPDGHWIAYETNESGRFEIVVQPFPSPTGKWQVSTQGGVQPRWSADGKELYFISPDNKMMASRITESRESISAAASVALFPVRFPPDLGSRKQHYAVSSDGHFLINEPVQEGSAIPITLILNWRDRDLRK